MDNLFEIGKYHVPLLCKKCNGLMIFRGVGEYVCEDCGSLDYDDYGKVRRFIENHRGATALQAEAATGVSQRLIRQMLLDGRLQLSADSRAFLHCEMCGKSIRSGRLCTDCETTLHRNLEDKQRELMRKQKGVRGFGTGEDSADEGQIRYRRRDG